MEAPVPRLEFGITAPALAAADIGLAIDGAVTVSDDGITELLAMEAMADARGRV